MKKLTTTVMLLVMAMLCTTANAQFLLLDDMEGNGPCSGRWTWWAGNNATGSIVFNAPNPDPTGLNTSSHVARFIKDTTCFEYMGAVVKMQEPFDLRSNSIFKMLVRSNTKDEIMFKLQPGADYTKAVWFTYKVSQINRWEEATFNFQSVSNRTDLNQIEVHYIDGKKANGILYFDLVQAPNPVGLHLTNSSIPMGQEDGKQIVATIRGDSFQTVLSTPNWAGLNLPPGVSIGNVTRTNDTTATITLSGNSPANYSMRILKLQVAAQEILHPNTDQFIAKGNVVFEGNPAWTLIFEDDFNVNGKPDPGKWTVDAKPKGWINGEQQVYTDSSHTNAVLRNGSLVITGRKDFPNGNQTEPWSSARLITQGKMDFKYGKVEVRARLPRARGSWPAIWLMPTTSAYGAWPRSGEIDIMEHVGNNFGKVLSTVHTQNNNWTNGGHLSATRNIPDADQNFHTYSLEWSADSLRFMVDSLHIYTYTNPHTDWKDWPFDQQFHVILNVAIGGGMGGNITEADWPDSMLVDYVRVYQKGLGTPVLDSLSVSPSTGSVLPGKKQQFIAKAIDQNGFPLSITPVWSITGTGNTITTAGLATIQSSGIITATAMRDSITKQAQASFTVRPTNYKPVPAKIEAEQFDNSNSCCTETTSDTGGGINVSYIGAGTWFEYDITVPSAGLYRFQLRAAVASGSTVRIMQDTTTLSQLSLPVSGGWQNWISVGSEPIPLQAGNQTIRIQANKDGWNFNWLKILPADSLKLTTVTLLPDTVQLIVNQTKQFSTVTKDQFNDYLVPAQPLQWFITGGSGNSVSASGLFTASTAGNFNLMAAGSNTVFGKAFIKVKPLPVVTRLVISPDSITVPTGAGYTFNAIAYDQFDSVMNTAISWTVSGTNNSIDATGQFTAGNQTGYFTVSATAGNVTNTVTVRLADTCTVNNKYEAESCSNRAPGPWLQPCTDIGGGQNFAGLSTTHWFAYSNLVVPVAGRYNISFRVSTTAAAKLKVGHSGMSFGEVDIPNTGGAWQTITDTMTLPALSYTGVHVLSGSLKFNWWAINNCSSGQPAPANVAGQPKNEVISALEKDALQVYPNPVTSNLTIVPGSQAVQSIALFNANGQLLERWIIQPGQKSITRNLSGYKPGIYLLKPEGGAAATAVKIIR